MPARRVKRRSYSYRSTYKRRSKKLNTIRKMFKLFCLAVSGMVLFSVTFYFYTLTQNLRKPFAIASNGVDFNSVKYDSTRPFTMLFVFLENKDRDDSEILNFYLYHIDPTKNSSVLFTIPANVSIKNEFTEKETDLSQLYSQGNLMNENEGVLNILKFIENHFAIDIDSYVLYDKQSVEELNDLGINLKPENLYTSIRYRHFLKLREIFNFSRKNILSDLSSVEALKLLSDTKNITVNYKYIKLNENMIKNIDNFDSAWQENTFFTDTHKERHNVTILNSTNVSGLAGWGARYVKNIKGIVLEVGNYPENEPKNIVYTNLTDSKLLEKINTYFEVDQVLLTSDFKVDPFLAERSDIILVLGEKSIY